MDWIEHFFGLSPDGGSGSFEFTFALGVIGIAGLLGGAALRWLRSERTIR